MKTFTKYPSQYTCSMYIVNDIVLLLWFVWRLVCLSMSLNHHQSLLCYLCYFMAIDSAKVLEVMSLYCIWGWSMFKNFSHSSTMNLLLWEIAVLWAQKWWWLLYNNGALCIFKFCQILGSSSQMGRSCAADSNWWKITWNESTGDKLLCFHFVVKVSIFIFCESW